MVLHCEDTRFAPRQRQIVEPLVADVEFPNTATPQKDCDAAVAAADDNNIEPENDLLCLLHVPAESHAYHVDKGGPPSEEDVCLEEEEPVDPPPDASHGAPANAVPLHADAGSRDSQAHSPLQRRLAAAAATAATTTYVGGSWYRADGAAAAAATAVGYSSCPVTGVAAHQNGLTWPPLPRQGCAPLPGWRTNAATRATMLSSAVDDGSVSRSS